MRKQWWTIVVFFLIVVAFPVNEFFYNQSIEKSAPHSSAGTLDLREWNFESEGLVALNGQWEFYRGQLLLPEQFADPAISPYKRPELTGLFPVPAEWNSYIAEDGNPQGAGFGTYRLRVELNNTAKTHYGIRTTNIRMANRIFINGQEVGASGVPGVSDKEDIASNIPYVGFVPVDRSYVEIIVQVSNFNYASGGIIYPIWFGYEADIRKSRDIALFGEFMNISGFALFSMFFLLLFYMRKKSARCFTWLYFA